jgi:hypothetical protein
MGALPNRQSSEKQTKRKAPARAKRPAAASGQKCAPRGWKDLDANCRAGTSYAKGEGYFIVFHAFLADLFRLSSGLVCERLCHLIAQNLSRNGKGAAALPDETAEMSIPECATLIGCDERSINRVLEYLVERRMATVARLADSLFVISLRYREWSTIQPSYREWDEARRLAEVEAAAEARRLAEVEAAAEDLQEDSAEELAVKPGVVPITSKPRVVKAGHRERALPITAGAKSFRFEWETVGVDLRYTAAIHSGEVVVTACIAESKTLESKQHAKRAESTSYESSSGHGCPNGQKIPPNVGTRDTPQKGGVKTTPVEVTHSRAAELSSLFDPLIYRWCQRTLSGDPKVLQQACEAIGDTPNDILVKVAVERGSRTLTPLHVPALCRQIAADWQRSKTMPIPPPMGEPQTKGAARAQKLVEGLKALDRLRGKKGA